MDEIFRGFPQFFLYSVDSLNYFYTTFWANANPMARIKPVIRRSHELADGKFNVKIRVSHNKQVRYIKTEYHIEGSNFDDKMGRVVPGGEIDERLAERMNSRLAMKIGTCHKKLERHFDELPAMGIQTVMQILREEKQHYDFFTTMDDQIKRLDRAGKVSYRNTFIDTRRVVERFARDFILPFSNINDEWLKDLENHILARGCRINTVNLHMRNIRTIYNYAINKGLADLSNYPFRRYKIPKQRTIKRSISADDIHGIAQYGSDRADMAWARDMFMLSFYLIGINMKDLFFLSLADFDMAEDRINYVRFKGRQYYSVKIPPEAMDIIHRYPGSAFTESDRKPKERLLLDVMEKRYRDHRYAIKGVNRRLQQIAKHLGISQHLTTYIARHTWATIAARLGISYDTIRYALGHQTNADVTSIYIDYDQDLVDQANRKVIDAVNKPPAGSSL